jgi:Fe-S cluster assembly iron-binding protein IscA
MSFKKVTITDEAIKELRLIADRQNIKNPAVYLNVVRTCCSYMPKVDVVDQTLRKIEVIDTANGVSVCVGDFIKKLLIENEELNSVELKVYLTPAHDLYFQFLTRNVENAK